MSILVSLHQEEDIFTALTRVPKGTYYLSDSEKQVNDEDFIFLVTVLDHSLEEGVDIQNYQGEILDGFFINDIGLNELEFFLHRVEIKIVK